MISSISLLKRETRLTRVQLASQQRLQCATTELPSVVLSLFLKSLYCLLLIKTSTNLDKFLPRCVSVPSWSFPGLSVLPC